MICIPLGGAYQVNDSGRVLCADVREALRRAGESLKSAAITIEAPENKLSDQLNGKAPFTFLWRLMQDMPAAFAREFHEIRATRHGDTYVKHSDLVELIATVRTIGGHRALKASLPADADRRIS